MSSHGRRMREAEGSGGSDARRLLERPETLGDTQLGDFGAGGPTQAAVRRAMHRLRVPPRLVAAALAGSRRSARARSAAERYGYWYGARRVLPRTMWRQLTSGTVVLMYHAFGRAGEPASRFVVPASRFGRQLSWLVRRHRTVIGLDDLVACRLENRLPPPDAVVLTIDDGYADTHEVAAPLLRRFGFPATVFLTSCRLGGVNDWDGPGPGSPRGRGLLSTKMVEGLEKSRISVGAHTRSHPRSPSFRRKSCGTKSKGHAPSSRASWARGSGTSPTRTVGRANAWSNRSPPPASTQRAESSEG